MTRSRLEYERKLKHAFTMSYALSLLQSARARQMDALLVCSNKGVQRQAEGWVALI